MDSRRRYAQPLARPDGLCGARAAHRLRQHRESAALTRRGPAEGDRDAPGARRRPRGRLVRQLCTESLLIAVLGAAVGLVLARLGRECFWPSGGRGADRPCSRVGSTGGSSASAARWRCARACCSASRPPCVPRARNWARRPGARPARRRRLLRVPWWWRRSPCRSSCSWPRVSSPARSGTCTPWTRASMPTAC